MSQRGLPAAFAHMALAQPPAPHPAWDLQETQGEPHELEAMQQFEQQRAAAQATAHQQEEPQPQQQEEPQQQQQPPPEQQQQQQQQADSAIPARTTAAAHLQLLQASGACPAPTAAAAAHLQLPQASGDGATLSQLGPPASLDLPPLLENAVEMALVRRERRKQAEAAAGPSQDQSEVNEMLGQLCGNSQDSPCWDNKVPTTWFDLLYCEVGDAVLEHRAAVNVELQRVRAAATAERQRRQQAEQRAQVAEAEAGELRRQLAVLAPSRAEAPGGAAAGGGASSDPGPYLSITSGMQGRRSGWGGQGVGRRVGGLPALLQSMLPTPCDRWFTDSIL